MGGRWEPLSGAACLTSDWTAGGWTDSAGISLARVSKWLNGAEGLATKLYAGAEMLLKMNCA